MSVDGPSYDPATGTHRITVGRLAFDAVKDKQAMLSAGLFAEMVTNDDYVWVECEGESVLLRVTGIAAVTEPDREREG